MKASKTAFLLLLVVSAVSFSCKNTTEEAPEQQISLEKDKSFHEKYLEEIQSLPTREDSLSRQGMVKVKAGTYIMGGNSAQARNDEFPRHQEEVPELWVDQTEVTNAQFRAFVEATDYITTAQRPFEVDGKSYPPGALVFDETSPEAWWGFQEGASWEQPYGPGSTIEGKDDHPVVQVSWYDANAYAKWAGKRLPTEAEYEYLKRGGASEDIYPWGNDFEIAASQTNFHQGEFPIENKLTDNFEKTAPVRSFPANGYGLYDVAGNVWEWVLDTYHPNAYERLEERTDGYFKDYHNPQQHKVIRGGSFLCNESYCTGYRNAARMSSSPDSSLEHLGFRCVREVR